LLTRPDVPHRAGDERRLVGGQQMSDPGATAKRFSVRS
jgi:hypothetical protein